VAANGLRERPHDYAVVWRTGDGPTCSGRLELREEGLILSGAAATEGLRIPLAELSSVEIGRAPDDRINGEKSLVLQRRSRERVLVAALGGIGLLSELNDLLARLRAERTARASVAVVVPIRRGTADEARRLVEEGPPFEIEQFGLERHRVFVGEREVVFFFEGENAAGAVDALAQTPSMLQAAVRWRRILAGPPRLAEERFAWDMPPS
jgi:hypothetical protein